MNSHRVPRLLLRLAAAGLLTLPIVLGILVAVSQSFAMDLAPASGSSAWSRLLSAPGVLKSLGLAIFVGVSATALSLFCAMSVAALALRREWASRLTILLPLALAIPHSAIAIGISFVLSPSGWLARLFSPWATGWRTPPDIASVNDAAGLALIVGLVVKEFPFLLFLTFGSASQLKMEFAARTGAALGYSYGTFFAKALFAQVYARVRLGVYAVLAFSLSVVDVSIILGPSAPPTFSVMALKWLVSYERSDFALGFAAAVLQAIVVLSGIASLWAIEMAVKWMGLAWIERGARWGTAEWLLRMGNTLSAFLLALVLLSLASLAIWSVTWQWRFPDALPGAWGIYAWTSAADAWSGPFADTLLIGAISTAIGMAFAVSWLEIESPTSKRSPTEGLFVYLPLLMPQIAFLYGLYVFVLKTGYDASYAAIVWSHVIFVVPYIFISLRNAWQGLDSRFVLIASTLGAKPFRTFLTVKVPLLIGPILSAIAIGFSVSVAQYLPTLFLGAGKIGTLTTEAVTLSSGSDRRIIAVYAILQCGVTVLGFLAAIAIPRMVFFNRRGMSVSPT